MKSPKLSPTTGCRRVVKKMSKKEADEVSKRIDANIDPKQSARIDAKDAERRFRKDFKPKGKGPKGPTGDFSPTMDPKLRKVRQAKRDTRAKKLGIKDLGKKYNIEDMVKGDVIFCATGVTSGDLAKGVKDLGNEFEVNTFMLHKSQNIINAIKVAKKLNIKTLGITGSDDSSFKKICDLVISVPASRPDRIQEMHIAVGQIICEILEEELC